MRLRVNLRRRWLILLLAILAGMDLAVGHTGSPAPAADADVLKAASALYEGIRTETLPNGLRVYLKPVPGSPVVSTMVAYRVGSADEELDQTGLSHYLEHLMFKGTDKLMPGDIDRLTLRHGGRNNAYTTEDCTVYHFDFAAERWEVGLEIEADRMRNLRIDEKHEFQQEKGAVIAELDENEDQPWDLEHKAILPILFGTGPYGHPIIGERAHVRAATAAIIKAHYDKWYHPNNAVLVVCGGFDPERALTRIKELFGPIPRGKLPDRKVAPEVLRDKPVHKEIPSKFDVPRMLMGFNTVRGDDPDSYALDVIQVVLAGGKTSRLYRKLVEGEEIASDVSTTSSTGRYPGWFSVELELLKGQDRGKAEQLVLAELTRLRDEPIQASELKRVQRSVLASAIFGRESVHDMADSIARGVVLYDLDHLKNYLPRLMAVTAADVQRVAKKYLDPQKRVVIWSVPKETNKQGASTPREGRRRLDTIHQGQTSPARQRARLLGGAGGTSKSFSLTDARRVVLPNGLTLLLLERRQLPIVVAEAYVRNVRLLEPADKAGLAVLTGSLLEEGTASHSGPQIAEMIEDVGGELSFSSTGGSLKVLAPDQKLGLKLFFDSLIRPTFPKEAFARLREQQLSEIGDAEKNPEEKASEIYRGLIYGSHPLGRPARGTQKTVAKLTRKDCVAFHRQVFVPGNVIVALVGDFDARQMIDEVTRLSADWKAGPVPKPNPPPVALPEQFTEKLVTLPHAERLYFYLGHPGIRRDNPDYFKLLVMDYVLGTGPGFTDRLSARLRDRKGLAYSVSATITASAAEEPGQFTCYIGSEPRHFAEVKSIFLEELTRIRKEPPKAEEVADVQKYLIGSLPFQFTTNERIADQLLYVERFGLGLDYLDRYRQEVRAVTPADVQAVAQKYLDPQRMVLVAAGAIDAKGKPLAREK